MAKMSAGAGWLANIPWDKLFAFAEKMFANCAASGIPPETIIDNTRNPPARVRRHLENITEKDLKRNKGMSNKEWRQHKDLIMERVYQEGRDSTDNEIKSLILAVKANGIDGSDLDEDLLED